MKRMDKLLTEIGKAIRLRRKARNLSQDKLAEISGLNSKYLGKIERGEINVTVSNLARIAKGLKSSISDLFPRERSARAEQSLSEIIALLETKDAKFLKTSLALLLALEESSK